MKKRPVSAAAVAHPPPHPDSTLSFILTCPERGDSEVQSPLRAVTSGAVGMSGASGNERRGRRQGPGRQQESRQPPAAALALPIPAGLEQRTPRANESGEGAGGEGRGTVEGSGGVPTPAPEGRRQPLGEGRAAARARGGSRGRGPPP